MTLRETITDILDKFHPYLLRDEIDKVAEELEIAIDMWLERKRR